MNLYMFRAVPLPIIRSSLTLPLALVYVYLTLKFANSQPYACRDIRGTVHYEFVPTGQTVNQGYYLEVLRRLCEKVRRKRP